MAQISVRPTYHLCQPCHCQPTSLRSQMLLRTLTDLTLMAAPPPPKKSAPDALFGDIFVTKVEPRNFSLHKWRVRFKLQSRGSHPPVCFPTCNGGLSIKRNIPFACRGGQEIAWHSSHLSSNRTGIFHSRGCGHCSESSPGQWKCKCDGFLKEEPLGDNSVHLCGSDCMIM